MRTNIKKKVETKMKLLGWDYDNLTEEYNKRIDKTIHPSRMKQIINGKRLPKFQIIILNKIFRVESDYWGLGKASIALIDSELETIGVAEKMNMKLGNACRIVNLIDSKGGGAVSNDNLFRFAMATGKSMEWFMQ